MDGRLNGMIQTVAGYAKQSGKIRPEQVDNVLSTVKRAQTRNNYLAISPQFIVTATKE